MKKFLSIVLSLLSMSFLFIEAKDTGSIEHIEDNIILTYNSETIILKDNDINTSNQKCPVGYHIGSSNDWSNAVKMWYDIKGNKYKYLEITEKSSLYNLKEDYPMEGNTEYKAGLWDFKTDFNITRTTSARDEGFFRTSSNGNKNMPYIFIYNGLNSRREWPNWEGFRAGSVSFKTCNYVNEIQGIKNANGCRDIVYGRCFKDDKNAVINNGYSKEYNDAYIFAYNNKITTMTSIEEANMNGEIIRAEIAKMLANWVKLFGYYSNPNIPCNFTDTSSVKGDLAYAIIEVCKYGIMGQGITEFRPYDKITKAEVATAISRILWGTQYDGGTPFYTNHIHALENAGVLPDRNNINSNELRGNVMIMLMKANNILKDNSTDCDSPEIILACGTDGKECPEKCKN